MKLLSYGLLAVLAFSAWADNHPQRSGTKLTRNRQNGQRQNRIIHGRNQIGKNGKKRRPSKRQRNNVTRKQPGKRRINQNRPKAVQRFGRLGQINTGKKQRNLIRNKKDGKPQRPKRNKATRKVRVAQRKSARNGQVTIGRILHGGRKAPISKNGRTGQGYYQNDYYYYYDDPSLGAADPAATGYYDPDAYTYPVINAGSENCDPSTKRITYWDKPDEAMRAIRGLTQEDAALLLKDVKALKYGNTGKFLMRNGGTVSYTSKSHSLLVNEVCEGEASVPYVYPTYSPGEDYVPEGEEHVPEEGYYYYGVRRNGVKKGTKKGVRKGSRKMANKKKGKQ